MKLKRHYLRFIYVKYINLYVFDYNFGVLSISANASFQDIIDQAKLGEFVYLS